MRYGNVKYGAAIDNYKLYTYKSSMVAAVVLSYVRRPNLIFTILILFFFCEIRSIYNSFRLFTVRGCAYTTLVQ